MNIHIKRANAAAAFLSGRGIPEEDVLSLDVAKDIVRLHIYGAPLSGVSWETKRVGEHDHHHADVVQDGVVLRLVTVTVAEVAA